MAVMMPSSGGPVSTNQSSGNRVAIPGTTTTLPPLDSGWYVFGAVISGILLSGTRVAPLVFGLLSLATLRQLDLMLQHQ